MKNVALFTWTNTEYEDVFPVYFGGIEKYFSQVEKSYVAINALSEVIDDQHLQLVNDEQNSYAERILGCLDAIEEEYIIYAQEDFMLYDKVSTREFNKALNFLKKNEEFSCVKLLRSGADTLEEKLATNIYKSCDYYSAVHQVSIWKKDHLVKIINLLNPVQLRNFEYAGGASRVMHQLGYQSAFYFHESSPHRGGHFDSKAYPYIATALIKGKWNTAEYQKEINQLALDYNIQLANRGTL